MEYICQLYHVIGRICSGIFQFKERHYMLNQRLGDIGIQDCVWLVSSPKNYVDVFKYSVRKHIEEEVFLPAVDGFLSHNVCMVL